MLSRANDDLGDRLAGRPEDGRKGASPSLVLRGSLKLLAGLATRRQEVSGEQLSQSDLAVWREKRAALEKRRARRTDRRLFRQDTEAYLYDLENKLNQSLLRA